MKKIGKIRFAIVAGLIFSFVLPACVQTGNKNDAPSIQWENGKAAGLQIPLQLLEGLPVDSVKKKLRVYLGKGNEQPVLGDYSMDRNGVVFRPLIAFTRGLTYEIRLDEKLIAEISIPVNNSSDRPQLVHVYPHLDTVPSNLLKIYFEFSKPMQEGAALQYVTLTKKDSLPATPVFLDLQTELWNAERTMLTLWLDPGRIKRDLQPNKALGPPLGEGITHQLRVRDDWRDTEGNKLEHGYIKNYVIGPADTISPAIERWTLHLPKAGSTGPLRISLHESLDHVLLKHSLSFVDLTGNALPGSIEINDQERSVIFNPSFAWKPGNYTLECESRLEDLAGNNLNRLFDKDLTQRDTTEKKDIFKREFRIE